MEVDGEVVGGCCGAVESMMRRVVQVMMVDVIGKKNQGAVVDAG